MTEEDHARNSLKTLMKNESGASIDPYQFGAKGDGQTIWSEQPWRMGFETRDRDGGLGWAKELRLDGNWFLNDQTMRNCAAKFRLTTWALLFAGLFAVSATGRGEVVVKQAADTPLFSSPFLPDQSPALWKLDPGDPVRGSLKISDKPELPGFLFSSPSGAAALAEWPVGNQPFELWFDVDLTHGVFEPWRYQGVAVMMSSAPLGEMTDADVSVGVCVGRAGLVAALKQGGEKNPPLPVSSWAVWARIMEPRYDLGMGGSGGEMFSVPMPKYELGGMKFRVRMQRVTGVKFRFAFYNADGDFSRPWWEGETEIPDRSYDKDLRGIGLKYLSVIGQGEGVAAEPQFRIEGRVSAIQGWVGTNDPRPIVAAYEGDASGVVNGSAFVIKGDNFSAGAKVFINGKACETQVVSPKELRVTAAGLQDSGTNQVLVKNADGAFRTMDEPLYAGLQLSRFEPREALPAGGEVVTLVGGGFTSATQVQINGKDAPIVGTPTSGRMQVKVPAGEAGLAKVTASNGGKNFQGDAVFAYSPHPFVFFKNKAEMEAKKAQFNDPKFADYKKAILAEADKFVAAMDDPNLNAWTNFGAGVLLNAFAYSMTGEQKYLDGMMKGYRIQFERGDKDVYPVKADQFPGSLRQNLTISGFHIQNVVGWAYMYDVLFDKLTPEQRARILAYLDYTHRYYANRLALKDWHFAGNSSNTVPALNGICGLSILPLLYGTPGVKETVAMGTANICSLYHSILEDGGCREGSLYWAFALSPQLMLGRGLENALGDDMKMLSQSYMPNMNNYAAVLIGGDGNMMTFNDTQPWLNGWVPAAFAGSRFDQPLMRWISDEIARRTAKGNSYREIAGGYAVMAFLFRDTKPVLTEAPALPTLLAMPVLQWGVMRSSPQALGSGLVVGVKGVGGEQIHHAQEDAGSFVLQSRGESMLIDPGYFHGTATEHSLPLIGEVVDAKALINRNGAVTTVPGATFDMNAPAPLLEAWEKGSIHSMTVDLTKSYRGNADGTPRAALAQRVLVLAGDKGLVVLDNVQPTKPGSQITTCFQAGFPTTALPDGAGFRVEGTKGDLIGIVNGPKGAIEITPMKFNMKWVFDDLGVKWHRIEAPYTHDANMPRITVLMPVDKGVAVPAAVVKRDGNKITVTIPGAPAVEFASENGIWKSVK
jgi:IPT/TIG domain/Heparinase II/III-like protein